jgi:hypothetical protein
MSAKAPPNSASQWLAKHNGRESDEVRSGLGSLIYLIVGVIVASAHHYFTNAGTLKPLLSAVLAVALWPLVLLGINLHVH